MYNHYLVFLWLSSISILLISSLPLKKPTFKLSKKTFVLAFVILSPLLVRILNYDLSRIHGDDLISSYFSANYNFGAVNFFSMMPQDRGEWVSQFPTIYFAFQKLFFVLFGENILTVKLSVVPYIFIVSLMIFLIIKKIFNIKTAIIAIIIYSFFAPSLYLETLGLHFISSTAMFLIFFYFLILSMNEKKIIYPLLTGVFCAFCYLFYTSSYIALPILIFIYFIQFTTQRRLTILKNFLLSILSFLIIISPFITYAYKYNNYFDQRINQVSLLNGEWSGAKDRIKNGENPLTTIKENLLLSFKSLYVGGIGGHGGYNFGNLAFLERFTLLLFIIGLLAVFKMIVKKMELFFVVVVIVLSYITGVIFTIPPPAYHRFSLAFPFIVVVISAFFYYILSLNKMPKALKLVIVTIALLVYSINNQTYFLKSTETEKNNTNIRLAQYINTNFPNRNIYIASFPYFAFEKILYFIRKDKSKNVLTDYHANLLARFDKDEKYVYVIIFPEVFNAQFKVKDANGKIINFSQTYSLFVN